MVCLTVYLLCSVDILRCVLVCSDFCCISADAVHFLLIITVLNTYDHLCFLSICSTGLVRLIFQIFNVFSSDGVALDGDDPKHIQWVYQNSLERAAEFNITGVTYRLTQGE